MGGYTKLFASIVSSTIWREDDKTRLVWVTMLAMRDKHHIVEASLPGLADFAKVSLEDCQNALQKLSDPDPWSRTEDFEGRRIQKVDGGWLILNGEKYRNKLNQDDRREANRIYQQQYRKRKKSVSKNADSAYSCSLSAQEEEETETETQETKEGVASTSNWISELQSDPAYKQIDVQREFDKSLRWCKTNRRQLTRRRFVNWLNRIDKPLTTTATTSQTTHYLQPARIPSDQEVADAKRLANEEVLKLKAHFKMP